jgi:hypothetical protein
MTSFRPSIGHPLTVLAALAILAACNVSDSSPQADPSGTALFAPRLQAPAEGLRPAEYMRLEVWKRNGQLVYESIHKQDSILLSESQVSIKVPQRETLKYLLVGYVITIVDGVPAVDTVWTAADSGFAIGSDGPTTRTPLSLIKNWAFSPTTQTASSTTLKPGNAVEFRAARGQFIVAGSDPNLSCVGVTDTLVRIPALLTTPLTAWVRACGDGTTLPSTPRRYSWTNDTAGIGSQRTPLAPSPTGVTGFSDLDRLATAESDPTTPIAFPSGQAGSVIAWAVRVLDKSVVPDSTNFPPAPARKTQAPRTSTDGVLDVWSIVKDSLTDQHPTGMTVLVTAVRIDTGLGAEWPSAPSRFWYSVTPPSAPSRFGVTAQGWDSLILDWNLSNPALRYSAWYAIGSGTPDSAGSTQIPDAATDSSVWVLHSLPSDTTFTVVVKTTDPRTGLSSLATLPGRTGKLPDLPSAIMTKPNTNPAILKASSLDSVQVAVPRDLAGRTLKIRYAASTKAKSDTPDPEAVLWPDLSSPSVASSLSTDGKLSVFARPGEYLYISYVTEDSLGRRSPLVRKQRIEVVADDVDVPPPAPTGLRLLARTDRSLTVAWDTMPGFSYDIRWSVNGVRATNQAVTSTRFVIDGLAAGTPVDSISVKAIQIGNGTRFSGYSTPLPVVRTKTPPAPLSRASSEWVMDGTILKLRIRWTREAGTSEQTALGGVSSASETPASADWKSSVGTSTTEDSLDVLYGMVSDKPFVAFGRRAFRDSIPEGPLWTHIEVPSLAPAVNPDSLRIWQIGSLLKVRAPQGPEAFGFQLRVRVVQTSPFLDSIYTIQRGVGELKLGATSSGTLGARFWWERISKKGTARFDKGEEHRVDKSILPPPSNFILQPGFTENDWIFFAPADIRSGASVLLVRSRSGVPQPPEELTTGKVIQASIADSASFQIVQVMNKEDTSDYSPKRSLQTLGEPIASHPEGTYLFPFRIQLTGSTPQVYQSAAWTNTVGLFDPFAMSTFETRSVAPFGVSSTRKFTFEQDITFRDPVWGTRVEEAKNGVIGKSLVAFDNAKFSYSPTNATGGPATISFSQATTTEPAVVGFTVDPVKGSRLDLSSATGLVIGTTGSNPKISPTIFLHVLVDREEVRLRLPTVLDGTELRASLVDGTTSPIYTDAKGTIVKVQWADLPTLLSTVSVIGLSVAAPSGTLLTAGAEITSVQVVRARVFF